MTFGLPARILAAAVILALGLVALVVREGAARAAGQEVLLTIQGYDPRSLLTGHYVAFALQQLHPPGAPCPPGVSPTGPYSPSRWVALKRTGDWHTVVAATSDRAEAERLGDLAVRGRASCLDSAARGESPTSVQLDIGVDRFHIDQRQAQAMERALALTVQGPTADPAATAPPPSAFAVVSIGKDGKARLKGLIVDGQRTDLTWF